MASFLRGGKGVVLLMTQEEFDRESVRRAAMLFRISAQRRQRVREAFVDRMGISRSQHRLLMYLYQTDCAPSQTELAHVFEQSTAAIAVALKRLEKSGYIRQGAAINDTRYNEIALTDKGLELVQETNRIFAAADLAMLSVLTDEELRAYCACEEKLQTVLQAMERGELELPRVKGIHVRELIAGVGKAEREEPG